MEVAESLEMPMEAENNDVDSSYAVKPPDSSSSMIEGLNKPLSVPREDDRSERRIVKVNLSGAKRVPGNHI